MKISLVKDETKHGFSYLNHIVNWPWFTFPWTVLGLGALLLPLWRRALPDWPRLRFCYGWLLGNFALFATWAMQPMHYLLPVVPAVAVIEAALLRRLIEAIQHRTADRRWKTVAALLAFCFAGFAAATTVFLNARGSVSVAASIAAAVCLLIPAVVAVCHLFTKPDAAIGLFVAAGVMCVLVISGWIEPAISQRRSIASFGRELADLVPPREPVYFTETKEALPFYAPREFRRLVAADARALADNLAKVSEGYLLLMRYRFDDAEPSLRERFSLRVMLQQKRRTSSGADDLLLVRFCVRQA
jgi:hypothetical protein